MPDNWIEISAESLAVTQGIAFVHDPRAGGVGVFLGTARAETRGDGVELVALDYEAYEEMALKQMADLVARARERWPGMIRVVLLHRIGRVGLAEASVLIAVSTPHRADAFEACKWLIDTLKSEVAVWKKEVWGDGKGSWVVVEGKN